MVWFWFLVVFCCGRNIHMIWYDMIWVLSFYDYFYCGFLTKHGNGNVPDALLTYTSPNWLWTVHQGSEGSQKTGITQVKPSGIAFITWAVTGDTACHLQLGYKQFLRCGWVGPITTCQVIFLKRPQFQLIKELFGWRGE